MMLAVLDSDGCRAREEIGEALLVRRNFRSRARESDHHGEQVALRAFDGSSPRAAQIRPARGGVEFCKTRLARQICDDADALRRRETTHRVCERDALRVAFKNSGRQIFRGGESQ